MTTIHFKTKEFKEILKSLNKFATHTHTVPIVSIGFDPLKFIMSTDHAFISATPKEASVQTPIVPYSFNPEVLLNLSLSGDDVALYWEKEDGELHLKNGYLTTNLRIAMPAPSFDCIPDTLQSIDVPIGTLLAITKFLSIPFAYFGGDKDLMPVTFKKNAGGYLEACADDGYSLARITTQVPVSLKEFNVKVPKYMLDCIYNKGDISDEEPTKIGIYKDKSSFSNNTIQIYSSGMTTDTSNFEKVLEDFKPTTSCEFSPKILSEAIKPLVSIIPKKDQSGTILVVNISDNMSMQVKHKDVGSAEVGKVDGIDNIYHENGQRTASINMHPKSFQEYTSLFAVDKGAMYADYKMVHYKGFLDVASSTSITIEYLFPTVQV